jgi:protein-disulfide isomerase
MPGHGDIDPQLEQHQQHTPADGEAPERPPRAGRWLRTRRTWVVAAGLGVAALAAAVVLISSGGSSPQPADAQSATTPQRIDALLAGIPQHGDALGSPSAPVRLQFFGDLECPNSREFALDTLPSLIDRWVRGGKLLIEYRSLETSTREPPIFTFQQVAALAAGRQDKLWYYVENFYREQGPEHTGYVTEGYLEKLAEQTPGLDLERWSSDRGYPPLTAQVDTDEQTATGLGFHTTPAFLVGRTNGGRPEKLTHFTPAEPGEFDAAIERMLS